MKKSFLIIILFTSFTLSTSAQEITNPNPVVACNNYTLPSITGTNLNNPNYYSSTNGPSGVGTIIPVGTIITTNSIIYLYDEQGINFDEDTLNITINSSVIIDLGNDTALCPTEQLTLYAGAGFYHYVWSNNSTNQTLIVNTADTFWVQGITTGTNLVINGDFETGNTGFSTDYILATPVLGQNLLQNEGEYFITTDPFITHQAFPICGDHTSGTGNMLVVNGASIPNQNVWCQTITTTPNTNYEFSTWIQNYDLPNPAMLSFYINGVQLGNTFSPTTNDCTWNNFFELWNSGVATSANICIVNQSTAVGGNDFSLDDISFSTTCTSTDTIIVTQNATPIVNLNNTAICIGQSVILDAENPGATYLWQDNSVNQTFTATTSGQYSVDVTENGCTGSGTAIISTYIANVNAMASSLLICENEEVTLSATGTDNIFWSNGIQNGVPFTLNSTTTYTVTGTDNNQCEDQETITITVNPTYDNTLNFEIFEGDSVMIAGAYQNNSGTYYESLFSINGCDSTTTYILEVLVQDSIFIPNIFTPNGDNFNDLFLPIFVNIKTFKCDIYNRWGSEIYSWSNSNNGWDGKTKSGDESPEGTYFYIMTTINHKEEEEIIKGSVTLLK